MTTPVWPAGQRTDVPESYCPPGYALHQGLKFLVESDLRPAAVLRAAT